MVGLKWAAVAALCGAVVSQPAGKPQQKVVPGKAFDRIAIIWFENTDFDKAIGDPNFAALAKQGITLSNYYGATHPSQPNYISSISGDTFGMDSDNLFNVPNNVSTVIDLLEDKGISWAEYEEDMPSTGYTGLQYLNPKTHANMYVRKHNPAVTYLINQTPSRLANMKNTTLFYEDLKNDALPQWMFITPNMTSDGHDSSITVAGQWANSFLTPLLNDTNFMKNTLVLITFDENETYTSKNNVLGILLGDAVPEKLKGTKDTNFYDHYSEAATVEANWGLHTLGRWDVGANVFSLVARQTGDKLRPWPAITGSNPTVFLNESYPGPLNSGQSNSYPAPNTKAVWHNRTVLPSIVKTWGTSKTTYYNTGVEIPDGLNPPKAN
jgi:acid phosphatase